MTYKLPSDGCEAAGPSRCGTMMARSGIRFLYDTRALIAKQQSWAWAGPGMGWDSNGDVTLVEHGRSGEDCTPPPGAASAAGGGPDNPSTILRRVCGRGPPPADTGRTGRRERVGRLISRAPRLTPAPSSAVSRVPKEASVSPASLDSGQTARSPSRWGSRRFMSSRNCS